MSGTRRLLYIISGGSLALMFIFFGLFVNTKTELFLTLGITSLTICYHLTIRLVIGCVCQVIFHNKMNYRRKWFAPRSFENGLYKILKVKRWKIFMPTFDEKLFSMKTQSVEEIIGAGCQAEVVHELDIIASFLAILFTIPFGSFLVFLITSAGGAVVDLIFVIIQRYNRPRLVRTAERQRGKSKPAAVN